MSATVIRVRPLAPTALLVALCAALISILMSETAESSPTPPALSDTYPLKVSTVTVRFERALDLDHNEHASLTTTFAIMNTSKAAICEVWAKTSVRTDGHSLSQSLWFVKSLKPGEIRSVEDETRLDEDVYKAFKDIPLEKIVTNWKTEKVKMCDGTILDFTA